MPLYRALLCLAAVFNFLAAEPANTTLYDFKRDPISDDLKKDFEFLGYEFVENSGHIVASSGSPMPENEVYAQLAYYNFQRLPLDDEARGYLVYNGCRFDDESGRILSIQTHRPLRRVEVDKFLKLVMEWKKHAALEHLNLLFKGEDPSKPISEASMKKAQALAKNAQLPSKLVDDLARARSITAAALAKDFDDAYVDSTKYWDSGTDFSQLWVNSRPISTPWASRKVNPSYYDDLERNLGHLLEADFRARLERYGPGREILDKFKGHKLPDFIVLNVRPNAGASYSADKKGIAINLTYALEAVLSQLPEDQRQARRKELSDPKKFARYLRENPEARQAFVEQNDVTIVHELTHAWQDMRGLFASEELRGNAASVDPLDHEEEARMQEYRYFHARMLSDPAWAVKSPELTRYLNFLADYDANNNAYIRWYVENADGASLAAVQDLQLQRATMAERLMGESLYQRVRQYYRLQGLKLGSQEAEIEQSRTQRNLLDFKLNEYPRLQRDGFRKLAGYYESQGRPDLAFNFYGKSLNGTNELGEIKRVGDKLAESAAKTEKWLTQNEATLDAEIAAPALNMLEAQHYHWRLPARLVELKQRVYADYALKLLNQSEESKNPDDKRQLLRSAAGWAKAGGDKELMGLIASRGEHL